MRITRLSSLFVIPLLLGLSATAANPVPLNDPASTVAIYGKLPLAFEINRGQSSAEVKFLSRGGGYILFLTPFEAVLNLAKPTRENTLDAGPPQPALLRMTLVGARSEATLCGMHELPGKSNYFIGNNSRQWHTNVPTYAQVKRTGVYQGIDLVYYGTQGQLEYDFAIAPGSDPKQIALQFDGAEPALDANGNLILTVAGGSLGFQKPVVYQIVGHNRRPVAGRYVLAGNNGVRFEIGSYDHHRTLVIDPLLVYSSYLGGTQNDQALAVAV